VNVLLFRVVYSEWLKRSVIPASYGYTGVNWVSSTELVAAGNNQLSGAIVYSHDAGLNWKNSNTSISFGNLYDIASNVITGFTYSIAVDDTGIVYLSTNKGQFKIR
jgi:hypothetical protein